MLHRLRHWYRTLLDLSPFAVRDFSWKVRWRMRRDHNPLFIALQDKYEVKRYARSRNVNSAEPYWITENPQTIPFDSLPQNYFIKATHGCNWNIACENGKLYKHGDSSKVELTRQDCVRICEGWLKSRYSRSQWAYAHIPPRIVVEAEVNQLGGGALIDYRCYTFNGKVAVIQYDSMIYKNNESIFFDRNWKEIELSIYRNKISDPLPPRPEHLDELIAAAERLGVGLDFARVDLFNTTNGIILAEMTVYPEAGDVHSPTIDPRFNRWLGDQWILPTR